MSEANTLFLLARFGLKPSKDKGVLESWMWTLTEDESRMEFVSFHKTKSDLSKMGGTILGFREPTQEEYDAHQREFQDSEGKEMGTREHRRIILWERIPNWAERWPRGSEVMAYKALGRVNR